jgi:GT2 family glycosyltransferase
VPGSPSRKAGCEDFAVRLSVVIPTYRRAQALRLCLAALARQDRPADEILVVVRPEDRAALEVIDSQPGPVRAILVDRPGVVAAMNAGADASTGDVVALTDDDARPFPDWTSRMLATYATDPAIGAVGGRDWIHTGDRLWSGSASVVGVINRVGGVTGNHHLGTGPARDVDVLKGVNFSMRGPLLREIRFDERLFCERISDHWELAICFAVRRRGYRIVYDPAIAVDHHVQPRIDATRSFGEGEVRDAAFNESLALLEHLPLYKRVVHLAWAVAVGSRSVPGIAQAIRLLPTSGRSQFALLRGNLTGRQQAIATYRRSKRPRSSYPSLPAAVPAPGIVDRRRRRARRG